MVLPERLVSVVIVSFNTSSTLHDCLVSLREAACETILEIIVADNNSTDGTRQMVRECFPEVRLIANEENLGFGVANNQGVTVAHGKYVLLLNSDTLVRHGAIERLVAEVEEAPEIGLVGPRLVGIDGKPQRSAFRFPSPPVLLLEQLSLISFILSPCKQHARGHHDHVCAVDWLLGACLLGRRDLLLSLGPFDPDFFMYAEDVDLCYRVRQAGREVCYVPVSTITHLGGVSSRRDRARMAVQSTASMYLFYRKHYTRWAMLQALLIFRGIAILKLLRDTSRLASSALCGRQQEQRRLLREDLGIWLRVLCLQPPMLTISHEGFTR